MEMLEWGWERRDERLEGIPGSFRRSWNEASGLATRTHQDSSALDRLLPAASSPASALLPPTGSQGFHPQRTVG